MGHKLTPLFICKESTMSIQAHTQHQPSWLETLAVLAQAH